MSRFILVTALALSGTLLQADGLADLKAALKALPQASKVSARIEEESREQEGGKDHIERRTVRLEDGPGGTRILEDSRLPAPAGKSNPDTSNAKKGDRPFEGVLRPAAGLLEQLDKARLVEERPETREGQPVRRLKLVLEMKLEAEAKSKLKKAVHEATVWIGADGLPIAMDQQIEIKTRVLLVATIWTKVDIHIRYQRNQGRLLVLEERSDVQGSAMGKSFSTHETTRCRVLP